jgi:hypothetical protein
MIRQESCVHPTSRQGSVSLTVDGGGVGGTVSGEWHLGTPRGQQCLGSCLGDILWAFIIIC